MFSIKLVPFSDNLLALNVAFLPMLTVFFITEIESVTVT